MIDKVERDGTADRVKAYETERLSATPGIAADSEDSFSSLLSAAIWEL